LGCWRYIKPIYFRAAIICTMTVLYFLYFLPGIISPLGPVKDLIWLEMHLTSTIGVGESVAAGLKLFENVHPSYGLFFPTLFAIYHRYLGDFSAADYLRFIQFLHVLFALFALTAHIMWRPRHPMMWLIPALFYLPFLHTFHSAIFRPTQSAWRFIGFPLGILLLLWIGRGENRKVPFALGLIAGFLLLFNLETGIALSFGIGMFVLSRVRFNQLKEIFLRPLLMLAGIFTSFFIFMLFYRMGVGGFPLSFDSPLPFQHIGNFSSGMGGLKFYKDLMALLILVHSLFIFYRNAHRWRMGPLSFDQAFRVAISSCILVWFAYYANRPHPWNLWTFLFLYSFLIAEYLDPRWFKWNPKRLARFSLPLPVLMIGIVIIPFLASNNAMAIKIVMKKWESSNLAANSQEYDRFAGLLIKAQHASLLHEKLAYLRHQNERKDLIYFTVNTYFAPKLAEFRQHQFPFRDAFSEVVTYSAFNDMVRRIRNLHPARILFDDPESPLIKDYRGDFLMKYYRRLQNSLSPDYRPLKRESGWEIWEKTSK